MGTGATASRFELARTVYERPIAAYARKNFRSLPGTDPQDLESELMEVLWLACLSYDPDKGAKFNTYFWECAKRRFLDLHKAASRKMRVGDYFRVPLTSESDSGVEQLNPEALRVAIAESAEEEVMALFAVREVYRSRCR